MEWDDIEKKANEGAMRLVDEILEDGNSTTDEDVECIVRKLLMDEVLEKEGGRREKYDYRKAFDRNIKSGWRRMIMGVCAVACMFCLVVGSWKLLFDVEDNIGIKKRRGTKW